MLLTESMGKLNTTRSPTISLSLEFRSQSLPLLSLSLIDPTNQPPPSSKLLLTHIHPHTGLPSLLVSFPHLFFLLNHKVDDGARAIKVKKGVLQFTVHRFVLCGWLSSPHSTHLTLWDGPTLFYYPWCVSNTHTQHMSRFATQLY